MGQKSGTGKLICRQNTLHSQFVIATHSPMLMAVPDAEILLFGEEKLRTITLEETDAYGTMKMFMDNRELFLKKIIDDMEVK